MATTTFQVDVADLGMFDPGFSEDGQAVADYGGQEDSISVVNDVATDPADGSYVVVGSNTIEGDDDFVPPFFEIGLQELARNSFVVGNQDSHVVLLGCCNDFTTTSASNQP